MSLISRKVRYVIKPLLLFVVECIPSNSLTVYRTRVIRNACIAINFYVFMCGLTLSYQLSRKFRNFGSVLRTQEITRVVNIPVFCKMTPRTVVGSICICIYTYTAESNGKLPLRTCPGCSIPEPYRSPDWALVPAQTRPRAED